MSAPALELKGLSKSYGGIIAVDELFLDLGRGEFLTLLGSSGSGKTTTLGMVAGLVKPTRGSILLDGKPLDPLPPYRRDIGVVFQNYALFPHMTVAKNVAFPLEMRGRPGAEIATRVARALALVGLPEYAARYPRQLSGGQAQRVALARAMVFEPRILLMDEPLGALDKQLREQMQLEIVRLHKEFRISVVYVTHDQEEALVMSDRIAVFNRGRLEQVGPPHELYERPATRFVAGFIGESNFFPATVAEIAEGYCRLEGDALQLRARGGANAAVGGHAVVVVRPERIRLSATAASEPGRDNSVIGTLTEVIYLGRSRKYIVRLAPGREVVAFEQAQSGTDRVLAPGDSVRLDWRADDATILPAD
ncbi:MAG: ABC transporter ATP-binding protein [Reyranellales bacterium]